MKKILPFSKKIILLQNHKKWLWNFVIFKKFIKNLKYKTKHLKKHKTFDQLPLERQGLKYEKSTRFKVNLLKSRIFAGYKVVQTKCRPFARKTGVLDSLYQIWRWSMPYTKLRFSWIFQNWMFDVITLGGLGAK